MKIFQDWFKINFGFGTVNIMGFLYKDILIMFLVGLIANWPWYPCDCYVIIEQSWCNYLGQNYWIDATGVINLVDYIQMIPMIDSITRLGTITHAFQLWSKVKFTAQCLLLKKHSSHYWPEQHLYQLGNLKHTKH